jgi:Tfp pilus assembly PilM family ATPase
LNKYTILLIFDNGSFAKNNIQQNAQICRMIKHAKSGLKLKTNVAVHGGTHIISFFDTKLPCHAPNR